MVNKNSICAFVISLERDKHRRKYIEQHFFERNVAFEWFPAVDGLTVTSKDITNYRLHSYTSYNWWELTPTEIGCFESHRRIWNTIVERGLDNALIFEDDVYLVPSFLHRITSIIDSGLEFDLVKLDTANNTMRVGPLNSQIDEVQIRRLMSQVVSSAAYLISRQGCIFLVARSKKYCDPLDDFITKNWTEERIYQLVPALAVQQSKMKEWQADGMSIIPGVYESQREKSDKNFPSRKKGPILFKIIRKFVRFGRKNFDKIYGYKAFTRRVGGGGSMVIKVNLLND